MNVETKAILLVAALVLVRRRTTLQTLRLNCSFFFARKHDWPDSADSQDYHRESHSMLVNTIGG